MTTAPFDGVISPLKRDFFLSEVWGQSFFRIPGQTGKFQPLLPWSELNSILEHYSLASQLVRMYQDGKQIDPSQFSVQRDGTQRLRLDRLINCLSRGATMILDQVDELAPAVRKLAEAFEEVLHTGVCVNLYAGWRDQKGFDLHWDPQDTMILQLSGRKHWKVYPPTRLHPLKKGQDIKPTPKPLGDPVWDGILEDGDMIYVPRGWWHVASPLNEPSLHLTVTIVPPTGADFLKWLVHRLNCHAEVRRDVLYLASDDDRKQYLAKMRKLLTDSWSDDALETFLTHWEAKIPLRPHLRLPFTPIEQKAPITIETQVRLATARRLVFDEPDGSDKVGFSAGDITAECSPDLMPALQRLSGLASRSVRELCSQVPDGDSTRRLMIVLTALAMSGVVWLEGADAGISQGTLPK